MPVTGSCISPLAADQCFYLSRGWDWLRAQVGNRLAFVHVTSYTLLFMLLIRIIGDGSVLHLACCHSLFRGKNGTAFSNLHPNFSNIELAKPSNLSAEALREKIEAENEEQVCCGNLFDILGTFYVCIFWFQDYLEWQAVPMASGQ